MYEIMGGLGIGVETCGQLCSNFLEEGRGLKQFQLILIISLASKVCLVVDKAVTIKTITFYSLNAFI